MENASKALTIAAGVLLAVILISLISYTFSKMKEWPQQEGDMESAEQLAKFNLEYEVYEKKQMYGVDVISCLNKAYSNNEKYINGGGFLTGSKSTPEDMQVLAYISINSDLEESIEIWYFKDDVGEKKEFSLDEDKAKSDSWKNAKLKILNFSTMISTGSFTGFKEDDTFSEALKNAGTIKHTNDSDFMHGGEGTKDFNGKKYYSTEDTEVTAILENAANGPRVQVKNPGTNTTDPNMSLNVWSRAEHKTVLYDLKKRKFQCDYIGYNQKTGRVNEIYFSEI